MFSTAHRICIFALAAIGLHAQTSTPPLELVTETTGLVGIADGETAQFNALNPGDDGAPCTAVLRFITGDGTVFRSTTVTVPPGTGQYIRLASVADLELTPGERRQVRAALTVPATPTPSSTTSGSTTTPVTPACQLIGTLEIFATTTGITLVTVEASHEVITTSATPSS
jgi:hypothetical protein